MRSLDRAALVAKHGQTGKTKKFLINYASATTTLNSQDITVTRTSNATNSYSWKSNTSPSLNPLYNVSMKAEKITDQGIPIQQQNPGTAAESRESAQEPEDDTKEGKKTLDETINEVEQQIKKLDDSISDLRSKQISLARSTADRQDMAMDLNLKDIITPANIFTPTSEPIINTPLRYQAYQSLLADSETEKPTASDPSSKFRKISDEIEGLEKQKEELNKELGTLKKEAKKEAARLAREAEELRIQQEKEAKRLAKEAEERRIKEEKEKAERQRDEERKGLLKERKEYLSNSSTHYFNYLLSCDIALQSHIYCNSKGDQYENKIKADQDIYLATQESRTRYHDKLLKFLGPDLTEEVRISNFKSLLPKTQEETSHLQNSEAVSTIIDLLRYQADHLQISEFDKTLNVIFKTSESSKDIFGKGNDEKYDVMLETLIPSLMKIGRTDILKKYFPKGRLDKIFKLDGKEGETPDERIYKKLVSIADKSMAPYFQYYDKRELDMRMDAFRTYISLLSNDSNSSIYKNGRTNILHHIVEKIMSEKLLSVEAEEPKNGKMKTRSKSVSTIYIYKEFYKILCKELPPEILHKLLTQRDKENLTSTQLFFKKSREKENGNKAPNAPTNQQFVMCADVFLLDNGYFNFTINDTFFDKVFRTITWLLNLVAQRLVWKYVTEPIMQALCPNLISLTCSFVEKTASWLLPGAKLVKPFVDALFATTQSLFFSIDIPGIKENVDDAKKQISTGEIQLNHFIFNDYFPASGLSNPGDKWWNSYPVLPTSVQHQVHELAEKDERRGAKKCIATTADYRNRAPDMSTQDKIEFYKKVIAQKQLLEERIKEVESGSLASKGVSKTGTFFGIFMNKKNALEKQRKSTIELINYVAQDLNLQPLYKNWSESLKRSFSPLLNCFQPRKLSKMALEISENEKAGEIFDKFCLMVKRGVFPLDNGSYENVEFVRKKLKFLRENPSKKEEFEKNIDIKVKGFFLDTKHDERMLDTKICNKFIEFGKKEFVILIPKISENGKVYDTIKQTITLDDFVKMSNASKTLPLNKLLINTTFFNVAAEKLHSLFNLPKNYTENCLSWLQGYASYTVTNAGKVFAFHFICNVYDENKKNEAFVKSVKSMCDGVSKGVKDLASSASSAISYVNTQEGNQVSLTQSAQNGVSGFLNMLKSAFAQV